MTFKPLDLTACLAALGLASCVFVAPLATAQDDMPPAPGSDAPALEAVEGADAAMTETPAEPVDDGFANDVDRLSYAIGQDIGGSFKTQGIDINPAIMAEAITAAYTGEESRMTKEQMAAVIQTFQRDMQMKMMEEQMKQQAEQAAANAAAAEAFFAENKTKEGVQTTESGLQYLITEQGTGEKPGPTDTVTVHYTGKLLDGTTFDSSVERGEPVSFPLTGVIAGFAEGLQLMPVGSKGKLFIPGDLAYGEQGGPGGPNAALIFDIELIKAEKTPETPAAGTVPGTEDATEGQNTGGNADLPALGD